MIIISIDPLYVAGAVLAEAVRLPDGNMVIVGAYESCYPAMNVLRPGEFQIVCEDEHDAEAKGGHP